MSEVILIGIDLAKRVFQLHGAQRRFGRVSQEADTRSVTRVCGTAAQMPDRHGGLCDDAWLGSGLRGGGARCAPDPASLCKAIRQTPKE